MNALLETPPLPHGIAHFNKPLRGQLEDYEVWLAKNSNSDDREVVAGARNIAARIRAKLASSPAAPTVRPAASPRPTAPRPAARAIAPVQRAAASAPASTPQAPIVLKTRLAHMPAGVAHHAAANQNADGSPIADTTAIAAAAPGRSTPRAGEVGSFDFQRRLGWRRESFTNFRANGRLPAPIRVEGSTEFFSENDVAAAVAKFGKQWPAPPFYFTLITKDNPMQPLIETLIATEEFPLSPEGEAYFNSINQPWSANAPRRRKLDLEKAELAALEHALTRPPANPAEEAICAEIDHHEIDRQLEAIRKIRQRLAREEISVLSTEIAILRKAVPWPGMVKQERAAARDRLGDEYSKLIERAVGELPQWVNDDPRFAAEVAAFRHPLVRANLEAQSRLSVLVHELLDPDLFRNQIGPLETKLKALVAAQTGAAARAA